jgi:hypothetical protein
MRATTNNNKKADNGITTAAMAKALDPAEEAKKVCNNIIGLIYEEGEDGTPIIAGHAEPESICDSRRFIKAVSTFVESVITGDGYDVISSLTEITTNELWQKQLTEIVSIIAHKESNFLYWWRHLHAEEWSFDDSLLNFLWRKINREVAIMLYGMVSYLTDTTFRDIHIYRGGEKTDLAEISRNFELLFQDAWEK